MALIALSGAITTVRSPRTLDRWQKPIVAVAAGTLLGGALLHLLPTAVEAMGHDLAVWLWTTAAPAGI